MKTYRNCNFILLGLMILSVFSCTKRLDSDLAENDESYFGVIKNANGDILANSQIIINRLNLSAQNDEIISDTIETDEAGDYYKILNNSDKGWYNIRPLDENIELFTESVNSIYEYHHVELTSGMIIESENEMNFRFCNKNKLNIEINKVSNSYRELEIFITQKFESFISNNIGSHAEQIEVINRDTVITRDICRINNFSFSYKIKDGTNTISTEAISLQISQENPNFALIEY